MIVPSTTRASSSSTGGRRATTTRTGSTWNSSPGRGMRLYQRMNEL